MRIMCCAIVASDFMDAEKWDDVIQTSASARTNTITGERMVRWVETDGQGAPSWRGSVTVITEDEVIETFRGPTCEEGWE